MPRILHLADLHLGWIPRFMPRDRAVKRAEQRDSLLKRAVDFAILPESRIDLVVIAGDLFETHEPDAAMIGRALGELRRLETAGVQVVTVPGNHDEITYPDSVYRRHGPQWPGVLVRNPQPERIATLTLRGMKVHVYSLAYTGGQTPTNSPLRNFPREQDAGIHLAIFHGTLGNWGGERSLPLDAEALAEAGYDYIALGHIHKPQKLKVGRAVAVYPGCVEGKGFDDPGVGCFTVVQVEPGQAVVEEVSIPVTPILTQVLDVSDCGSSEELLARVGAVCPPVGITRVKLRGAAEFPFSTEALAATLNASSLWVELVDETERFGPQELDRWQQEPTILGMYVGHLREQITAAKNERDRRVSELALRRGVAAMLGGSKR